MNLFPDQSLIFQNEADFPKHDFFINNIITGYHLMTAQFLSTYPSLKDRLNLCIYGYW